MSTFSSPNSSPISTRPGIQVVRLLHGQVPQYQGRQSSDVVVRERNEMESFITSFTMSRQEAAKKIESYSPLKNEIKDKLKNIHERLMLLDDYNNLVSEIANRWEDLIEVSFIPKTEQQHIIVTMTNELKMLVKILTQGRNVEEFQNNRFSNSCSSFFAAAINARNNSCFLMGIIQKIKLDLQQMRNQGKITEERYRGVVNSQPIGLFEEWRMLSQYIFKQEGIINSPKESTRIRAGGFDKFNFNRTQAHFSKVQQQKQLLIQKNSQQEAVIQTLKKKILQHESEYNRLADELYYLKVNRQKTQSAKNNQNNNQQFVAWQSDKHSLETTLQSSKQEITSLQLRLNQSNCNISQLFSQMQAKQTMWRQQRENLTRELQARNSQLFQLSKNRQQLHKALDQLTKEKAHLQYLLNQKHELLDMESKRVATLNIIINQHEQTKRKLEQGLTKEKLSHLNQTPKDVQQKVEELRLQNQLFSTQLAESKANIERLTIQNNNLSKERLEMIEQNKRISSTIRSQQFTITMPTSPKRLEQSVRTINELNLTIKKLQTRLRNKDQQLQDSNQQVQTLNRMMQDMNQLGNSRTDNSALISQYEQKIQYMEKRIEELQKNAHRQADLSSRLRDNVKSKEEEMAALESLLRQAEQKISNIKRQTIIISDLRQQNGQLKQALQQSLQKLKNMQAGPGVSSISRINCLFQNDILENQPQHKRYLTQVIQGYMNMKIQKTRLVYAFDPNNKTNFHKYIDGKDNLVFIIKMLNGTYTAAYTEGPFQPRQVSDRQGLIIALSRQKYFTLNEPNRRAITYDDYYIIFGNSEIRLRSQEKKLFSNFGIANSYYKSQGQRVTVLLGGLPQQRQLQLDHYEVYQITFDV